MRDKIQAWLLKNLSTNNLRWLFRGLMALLAVNIVVPDFIPFLDELATAALAYEAWRALKGRKNAVRDVEADVVEDSPSE